MKIGDWRYTVWVANSNENADINMPDSISVWMGPEGTPELDKLDKLIRFHDEGLDGRCDFGMIPEGLSETGQRLLYRAQNKYNPIAEELQYFKNRFQKLYGETLDKFIQFYERK